MTETLALRRAQRRQQTIGAKKGFVVQMQPGFFKQGRLVAGTVLMLSTLTVCVHAQQQSSFVVPAAQAAAVSQARRVTGQIDAQIRRVKSVSESDLTTLVTLAGDTKQHPLVRATALSPLTRLKSDNLTGLQLAKIDQLVFTVLQEDDKAVDPDGIVKMQATSVAARVVRGRRFLAVLQPLTTDSREWVRTSAQRAYDSIK